MRFVAVVAALSMMSLALAGCLADDQPTDQADELASDDQLPYLGYQPEDPDPTLVVVEEDHFFEGEGGTLLHARIVRPEGEGPFPIIAQFTPYTAPGQNVYVNGVLQAAEPVLGVGGFDWTFVHRGYAFAYGDVRGTGDSSGCLDLRGQADIDDLWHFTEYLGTLPWSNGNVGFIGASYPGSEAHMAAIAGNEHLKATIPVVASTSFYHYHHNDGVPYSGQHSLGGTNTGYTRNAIMPTLNPQSPNYLPRILEEAGCSYDENMLTHGGLDQSGDYYEWWQERNLRAKPSNITVPVLMAQGLADWNVKPDHIAHWFQDLPGKAGGAGAKTLIAGQWGHQYPNDAGSAYGDWWPYAVSFFDTFLKELDTGMFQTDVAWVEDNDGNWHRSATWPLHERIDVANGFTGTPGPSHSDDELFLAFHYGGLATATVPDLKDQTFTACPHDRGTYGLARGVLRQGQPCDDVPVQHVRFTTSTFEKDTLISGVPRVDLLVDTAGVERSHLVVVMDVVDDQGEVIRSRENYGYLNPVFRHGLMAPAPQPTGFYGVTLDFYPQEDLIKKGERLQFTIRSNDSGRTIEDYDGGDVIVRLGDLSFVSGVHLPLRPADQQGVRLDS